MITNFFLKYHSHIQEKLNSLMFLVIFDILNATKYFCNSFPATDKCRKCI